MPTCETIQIAHEMHVHGAPAELTAGDVDQHVTTCADCRAYVAESKRIDAMTTFAIPEAEFSQLRSDVIDRRLPRLRRELYIGIAILVTMVVYGVVSKNWSAPFGAVLGFGIAMRTFERRSRRLEKAMLSTGRELLVEMREDLRREIATTRKWFTAFPFILVGSLAWAYGTMRVQPWLVFAISVAVCGQQWLWIRKRERELESLG